MDVSGCSIDGIDINRHQNMAGAVSFAWSIRKTIC